MYWAIKTRRYPILNACRGSRVCSHLGFYNLANFWGRKSMQFNSNEVRNICVNKPEKCDSYIHTSVAGRRRELIAEGKVTSIQIILEDSLQLSAKARRALWCACLRLISRMSFSFLISMLFFPFSLSLQKEQSKKKLQGLFFWVNNMAHCLTRSLRG